YGLLQEINAGSVALNSPMYRYYSSLSNIIYVPMEDGVNATQLAALGTNARPAFYSGVDLSSVSIFNGSAALPNIGLTSAGAKISGVIPGYSAPTAQALTFVFYMDAAPSVDAQVIYFGGSTFNVAVVAGSAAFKFTFYDTDGATVLSTSTSLYGTGAAPPEPLVMVIELSYSAGTITWVANWRTQDPQTGYSVTGSFTKTMAVFSGYSIPGLPDSSGVNTFATGHIAVLANIDTYLESPHLQSFRGYSGETAQGRMQRLLGEMGYSYQLWGWTPSDISQYMGAQPIDTLSNILDQCLSVSRGVLIDCRDVYAVAIVSRFWLENQNNAYQVSYTDATVAGKLGIDDNNVVRNSVTITRNGGSSTTSTTTDGRYALTNGFAGYSDTFNLYTDDQTTYLANAIRLIGSWEDPFFTSIPFNFARKEVQSSTTLQQQLEWLDISFAFTLTNLPYYLPARPAEVLIEKYVEELYRYQRLITFQTSPARPYHTAQFNMYPRAHVGLATAKLHADITAGATTMQVDVTLPETITYPGSPIALDIGGFEKVTCTAVSGTSSPYTFTITRGTPAITHKANETVRLWTRYFLCY
ncbi:MAG TPA: hypothetical protein VMP68_31255, partial [Candidatus Eisenbacteria bacterium]|nr:hypothetical protein [Candidatus Eisenbacteria bacterium]